MKQTYNYNGRNYPDEFTMIEQKINDRHNALLEGLFITFENSDKTKEDLVDFAVNWDKICKAKKNCQRDHNETFYINRRMKNN